MASYNRSVDSNYTRQVQQMLQSMGADLGPAGVDGKWGAYTQAAYEANKQAVDDAIAGQVQDRFQSLLSSVPAPSVSTVSVPSYSYEYYYSIGDALEAANYEKQKLQAQNNLSASQQALAQDVTRTKGNIEKSTNVRGFGRSSYTTDALQATDLAALRQSQDLLANFDQTLMLLDAQRHSNAAEYASRAFLAQEDRRMTADLANAKAENQMAMAQWETKLDLLYALSQNVPSVAVGYSGSGSSSGGKSSAGGVSSSLKSALLETGSGSSGFASKGGVSTRKTTIQIR